MSKMYASEVCEGQGRINNNIKNKEWENIENGRRETTTRKNENSLLKWYRQITTLENKFPRCLR